MTDPSAADQSDKPDSLEGLDRRWYWRANLRIVVSLLFVWFVVAYLISILFIDWFNQFKIGELGVGFWFAQQGSIFLFVMLVAAYAWLMDRLDQQYRRRRER